MKVSIKQSLIVYCYKADDYCEFKRRLNVLTWYIEKNLWKEVNNNEKEL